jgi:hypothetical protein
VPSEKLADHLARFTKQLFCLTTSNEHPYSFRGSATALKHKNQHLLFCCNHQISDVAPSDVVIPVDRRGLILVSGSRLIQLSTRPELEGEEMLDVCAMHLDPANYGETELERGFLNIKGADVWNGEPQTTFLVFGYPTRLRNLIVDEISGALAEIKVKMTATSAVYEGKSHARGVHAIKLARSGEYSSDGLSGGAVFHVGEDARGFYCGLAGIVLRGSDTSDFVHFMDARLIQQFFLHQAASMNVPQEVSDQSGSTEPDEYPVGE